VAQLQKELHTPLQYVHISATDPKLLTYLDQATPQKPAVMFCQHGVNRSGTAWGMYAAEHDWPEDKALKVFGIPNGNNGYHNKRDIDYGYRVFKSQSQNARTSATP
jgi:protein tyrosine/serine phosphatase